MNPARPGRDLYEERRRGLGEWQEWNREAVVELGESLHHDPPDLLLADPGVALVQLDDLTRHEDMERLSRESAIWVESRLHAYVAHYLIVKFDGGWLLDPDPESSTYGRYLVSVRHPDADSAVRIDVGDRVHRFLHRPPLRSLVSLVVDMEKLIATGTASPEPS